MTRPLSAPLMPAPHAPRRHPGAGLLLLASLLSACSPRTAAPDPAAGTAGLAAVAGAGPASAGAASTPPVSVTLVRAEARDFTVALDASGTVTALSSVDVKPQVSAQVLAVHVKEGQFVQRGQALFTLDARIDQANLKKAEAQLQRDEAALVDAKRQLARSQDLLRQDFVSQGAVDTSLATVDGQQAVVAADRAAVDAVKVQLSYSRISAPGAGRVGPIAVFVGSSVSPTGAAMLNITQIDPVAVAFNLPQRNLPDALKALAAGPGEVTALLPDSPAAGPGSATAAGLRKGKLSFVDSTVDATSGTVKVKAVFANKDQALWPGAYVSVKMALQTLPGGIVVPQAVIVQGARGTAVFVAGPGDVAAIRPVKVVAAAGAEVVVTGLLAGERVVLDGRQNLRPGTLLIERTTEPARSAAAEPGTRGPAGAASGAASDGARAP